MKIRQVTGDERLTTNMPLAQYAFQSSPGGDEQAWRRSLPYRIEDRTLIAEEAGRTLASVTAIPMRQNLRGSVAPMAGVASVATDPLARRKGHVRALLTQLLDEMRDAGCRTSALWPFRASFYEQFGYVLLPKARTVVLDPADLGPLLRAELPGELSWGPAAAGYDRYAAFTERLLAERHGFALFPDYKAVRLREAGEQWLVTAEIDGTTVGALTYRIDDHGGTLIGEDLLFTGVYGRALLLQFLARHTDQVRRASVQVPADETPELWATDLTVRIEAKVDRPTDAAPMARLLSLDALDGLPAGAGRVRVEVTGDRYLTGTHVLDGTSGRLELAPGNAGTAATAGLPTATLTAAGLSALAYGVLDPQELPIRGYGVVSPEAAQQLRLIFPRAMPYLYAEF